MTENGSANLVVVSSDVLPEIISKVLEAKRMKARGDAKNSSEACRAVGISRSAYYKYKDSVFTYEERLTNKIVSLYLVLCDVKGVLSQVLSKLYEHNVNILTVNQNIPVDDVATVTVSFRFEDEATSASQLRQEISQLSGVVSVKIISGE
ncbi:MAG: ACT domain-containing protein [Oscillospiraceae bacterium]|nr:ACT domain-containing protein [Oscillospiraceae bacterium]